MNGNIDLVLVAGAGASRDFGSQNVPLPLMDGFSEAIVKELQGQPGYREVTGLESGLDGQEFERRLGTFLQAVLSLGRIEPLLEGSTFFPGSEVAFRAAELKNWHQRTSVHLAQVVDAIYKITYELFNIQRVVVHEAADAYASLLSALSIGQTASVVFATTNYDAAAEYALAAAGRHPDAGDLHYQIGERTVTVDRLLDSLPGTTPILHLHGRLGWYRRPNSDVVYLADTPRHDRAYGVPVMVLPDPGKSYDSDLVIASL